MKQILRLLLITLILNSFVISKREGDEVDTDESNDSNPDTKQTTTQNSLGPLKNDEKVSYTNANANANTFKINSNKYILTFREQGIILDLSIKEAENPLLEDDCKSFFKEKGTNNILSQSKTSKIEKLKNANKFYQVKSIEYVLIQGGDKVDTLGVRGGKLTDADNNLTFANLRHDYICAKFNL
jgi:hypothetical protein